MEEAKSTGPTLLERITRMHHNWKYVFLRPTNAAVVQRYKSKFGDGRPADAAGPSGTATGTPATGTPPADSPVAGATAV